MSQENKPNTSLFSTIEIAFADQAGLRSELRSTLNAIIGYCDALRNESIDSGDSGSGEFQLGFEKLHKSGQRLLNAANSLLEASSLETGALQLGVERLSAKLLLQLRPSIDGFLADCDQWLERSEKQGLENYASDLRKIRAEGLKLISILENPGGSSARDSGMRRVAPVIRQTNKKAETTKAGRGVVLVVENNESNCDILVRQLHREGHTIFTAAGGATALQMARARKFDIILLGMVLREMNGYETLARLKADPAQRDIPVIMTSALEGLDPVVRCLEMGAEDYLALPFNPVILKAKINACLEKKRLRDQLVVQEKLASLGALTAGIAHEIKNPLNFVNNFAALSVELAGELKEELDQLRDKVGEEALSYIEEILGDLRQNAEKIREHGARADSIVRSMLLHSRGQGGEWQLTDLNALLAEYVQLAYHGMRSQDASFNVTIETDFDPSIGAISVSPQDLGRVFLNLINNACYAVHQKKLELGAGFSPTLRVSARVSPGDTNKQVEIRVRDNGPGVPAELREKIFNPFFTTKPPGHGTGLGLSVSYEIVVQQHHGAIRVESEPGEFTEFIVTLPH